MVIMERIRSETKDFGSEGPSSDRMDSAHFLAHSALALASAILSIHFFGKYHFKVPDMNTCPVSTIYPFISQEIHFAEAVFSIMAARRSET